MTIQDFIKEYNKKQSEINKPECKQIIALDLETTGLDFTSDKIIQIAATKYDGITLKPVEGFNTYINPGKNVSISLGGYLKCGITLNDLKDSPSFDYLADEFIEFLGDSSVGLIGYNIKGFDIPFLTKKLAQIGKQIDFTGRFIYDASEIEHYIHKADQISTFIRYYHQKPEELGLKPHDARFDIQMSMCIMNKQVENMGDNYNEYNLFTNIIDNNNFVKYHIVSGLAFDELNRTEQLVFTKGKYYNCPVFMVAKYDPEYIKWVFRKQSKECVNIIKEELKKHNIVIH